MEHEHGHDHPHGIGQHADVVVIGGGAAGLAAALQLARARRSVVVVDAGEPRNAPAAHMHSYLGHEGLPPAEFLALARAEVGRYGAEILGGAVEQVTLAPHDQGFDVALADGRVVWGRRVLVATGLVDELPDIPGVAEQWGRGVIHCPYCHGWEVRDQRIVVVATTAMGAHQALLFRQLSEHVTVVTHVAGVLGDDDERRLTARGVRIIDGPVAEALVEHDAVVGVALADGTRLDADAVVVAPRFVARTAPVRNLGIEPVPAPMGTGEMIETDPRGATSVAGVYAAGNVADVSHQVLQAVAEGSRVGAAINADLVLDDADRAGTVLGDTADDWDQRYAEQERRWSGHPNATLAREAEHLRPGTALDVGSGEGADAIWLAQRGWRVTAVDISAVAIERARRVADEAGVEVEWVRADLAADSPTPAGGYDLVTVHYPAFRHTPGDEAIQAILDAVAPGGTLLFVGHSFAGGHHHRRPGFDPADYVQPPDVAKHLDEAWTIEVDEERLRPRPPGFEGPDVPDLVLRARRR